MAVREGGTCLNAMSVAFAACQMSSVDIAYAESFCQYTDITAIVAPAGGPADRAHGPEPGRQHCLGRVLFGARRLDNGGTLLTEAVMTVRLLLAGLNSGHLPSWILSM